LQINTVASERWRLRIRIPKASLRSALGCILPAFQAGKTGTKMIAQQISFPGE